MSLVVHKLMLSPGTSGGNGSLQSQSSAAITATTINNNNASSVVGPGVANFSNTTITSITKAIGTTSTTIINAIPASTISGGIDGTASGANCTVNITPGHVHHSVLTPVSQLQTQQQQQQFHYPSPNNTTSMAVTVSAHTANRLPYQYTKLVHQSSPTATTPQGMVQQQHHTVLQQIPVTTIHHNFNNAGQQQHHHQFKGPQQTAIVTQSRQVALHGYSNQRLVNPSGNGGTNSEGSSGEPPPPHPLPPKCYVSSQYMKNNNNNNSTAGGTSYNSNGGGAPPSMITSVISSTATKSPIVPNEGRKAYLPLVLQDHNYMAAFPTSSTVTTTSSSSTTSTNNPGSANNNNTNASMTSKFSNSNNIIGGAGKLIPGTVSPVRSSPLTPSSPSHHQNSPTASVIHHHQSPSRTYSLSSKSGKGGSGPAMLSSSLATSVTSNVITNPGTRSIVQQQHHGSKLSPSSPHNTTRSPKAITYSLPRQGRFATTVTSPLQQHGGGTQVIQQQQHFGSPVKSGVKSGGVGAVTHNSVHRSVGVIQGGGGNNKTVTTSTLFTGQGGGAELSPAHMQNHQRYTYRRSTSTVSSGGGVPHHSPIITSILSPATHPAPIQTTQPSQVPLAGLQQYHNNNANNNRNYVYATSTTAFVPGASNSNNGVNIISGANPNTVPADGSYNSNNNTNNNNNNVMHTQASSGGVLMNTNNVSGGLTNNNVNILINNKTGVINKVSGSNNFITSGSSRNSPSSLIVPTGPAAGARGPSTPPCITYIPSPHIPPPPGVGSAVVSSHQPMSDLVTSSGASHLSTSDAITASVLNTSSKKDSSSSSLLSSQHHLGRNNNKGNNKRDANNKNKRGEEQAASNSSSSSDDEKSSSPGPSGEETETAPEGEGDDMEQEDSITRCVCDLTHDDGYMIQCDRCQVWQHVICMDLSKDNIPDEYLCEACSPRPVNKLKARSIQLRKRAELAQIANMMSSSDSEDNSAPNSKNKPGSKGSTNPTMNSGSKKKKVKIVSRSGGGLSRPGGGLSRPAGGLPRPGGVGLHSAAPGMKTKNSSGTPKSGGSGGPNIKKKKVSRKASGSGSGGGSTLVHINNNNNNLSPIGDDKEKKPITKTRRRKSSSSAGTANIINSPDVLLSSTTLSSLHSPSSLVPSCFPLSSPTPSSIGATGTPQQQLTYSDVVRGWVEGYEAAITNHYSPELRARVHAARINGISPHLRASVQGAVLGHRCKVVDNMDQDCLEFEKKVLVAGCAVSSGTALLEYQGKYLLWSQWCNNNGTTNPPKNNNATTTTVNNNISGPVTNPCTTTTISAVGNGPPADKASADRFLPFTLRYTLLQEGLSVAVDARTYGNEARFARRSCTPNAQVRHVVERGSLHLYIVAIEDIEEGGEILLPLHTCNTTELAQLPPCPATEHQAVCPHANTKRPQGDLLGKGPSSDTGVIEENGESDKPVPTPSTPTMKQQRITSPMSSPESSSLSPVSSPHSPLPSPKGSKSPSKMNITSPLRSPSKVNVSPFSTSGLLTTPRRLTSPVSAAAKKDRSPDQLQQTSPERENIKCHSYSKRTLTSLPIPLHQLRNCRRSISESCSRPSRISINNINAASSSEEDDDDEEDEDKEPILVASKTPEKSSKGSTATRRSSDDGPGGSFAPVQHQNSSFLKKRTISVDSRSSGSRKNCDGSATGSGAAVGSTVAGVATIGPPSVRLRNNSTSSSTGGTTPKSPGKASLNRSPSDTEGGGGGNESSGGGSSKENRRKHSEDQQDSKKMTREEKKIAAYMKAFELMEKRSQRKQEMVKKKVEDRVKGRKSDDDEDNSSGDETFRPHDKHRKKSKKSMRNNSRGQPCSFKKGSHRRRTTSGPPDDTSCKYGSGTSYCAPGTMEADAPATEHGGASPMASHTRFPKTKKSMMNDWLSECVDSDSNAPSALSLTSGGGGLSSGVGVPSHYMRTAPPTRRSSCAAIAGLSSAPPGGGGGAAVASAGGVSAKKRWLRQAISEEPTATCPVTAGGTSPTHAPDSPPGGDYTTPLKKRRLARESVSGENSNSCDTTQQQQQQAVVEATIAQEMAAPTAAPDAEVKMELDDDMKVKKEEGDLKYEAASSKASSLTVSAVATTGEAASVKTEPVTPKDEVEEEKPVVTFKCSSVEIVSATAKEVLTATVPAWNELGRLTRKRKRSVENLMAKVNGDPKLLVSDQTSSRSEGGGKGRNCDSRSESVINTDECVDTSAIENDGDVNKEFDNNRKVDFDVCDENSDEESSERSVLTRRDRAKKKLAVQRDDTGNKKVYRNKKSCVRYSSDVTDKSRKRGRPRKAGVKCVSSDNEGMETVEDKSDQGVGTRTTGNKEQVGPDNAAGSNLAEKADINVDDDDSQESGFEGFSEHTSSQHGSSSEVDVEGDSEDENQRPAKVLPLPEKGVTSEDKKTSDPGSTSMDKFVDATREDPPTASSGLKDVGVSDNFDMDCEVQIDDYTPDEAQGNDTTETNNDKCFSDEVNLCQSTHDGNDQATDGSHTEEESMGKEAEWRGAGPRTPEGPAPSSPERRACPRTPSDTPPPSPTPPSPVSSPPSPPPPPPPPPDSPPPPPPPPKSPPPPRSPLPSILQDDSPAGPSITTLGRTPLTTLGCTSSHCGSGGSPFGTPITTLASGSSLTTLGAPVTSLAENPLHYSSSTHSRPPLTTLLSHESVLPLTTLGRLDDSDLSLGSFRNKYALSSKDAGKKLSKAVGLYDQLANQSKIPMPVKRKLSILEYRKRKSVNSESDASNSPSNGSSGSASTTNSGSTSTFTGDYIANFSVNNRQTYDALDGDAFPSLSSGATRARSSSVESNESDCNQARLSSSDLVKGSRTLRSPSLANVFSRSPSPAMSPLTTISSSTACYLSQSGVSGEKLLSESRKSALCADSDDEEEEEEKEEEDQGQEEEEKEEVEEEELEEGELAGEQDDEEEGEMAMSCGLSPSGSPPSPPSPGTPPGTPPSPRQAPTPPPPIQVHSPDSPPSPTSSHSPFSSSPPFSSPPNVRLGDYSCIDTAVLSESVSTYRGTLTDRLNREFGLNVSEEDSDCPNLAVLGLGGSSSSSISTKDVPVPHVAIPIQRSSSGAPLPVPPPAVHPQNPSLSATAVGFPSPDSLSTQSSNLSNEAPFPKKFKTDNPNNFSEQRCQYYSSLPPR